MPSPILDVIVPGCQTSRPLAPELNIENVTDEGIGKCHIRCVPMLVTNGSPIDQWRLEYKKVKSTSSNNKYQKNSKNLKNLKNSKNGRFQKQGQNDSWKIIHEGMEDSIDLSNSVIEGGASYQFRSYAHNQYGWSDSSKASTYLMLPSSPSPPLRLRRSSIETRISFTDEEDMGKYSKRRRSNVAVIIVFQQPQTRLLTALNFSLYLQLTTTLLLRSLF